MLQPFNTLLHVVMTPNHEIISMQLHDCNSVTIMNRNMFKDRGSPKGSQPTGSEPLVQMNEDAAWVSESFQIPQVIKYCL